jgi:hypothetical protein
MPQQRRIAGSENRQRWTRDAPQQGGVVGIVPAEQVVTRLCQPSAIAQLGVRIASRPSKARTCWSSRPAARHAFAPASRAAAGDPCVSSRHRQGALAPPDESRASRASMSASLGPVVFWTASVITAA